MDTCNVVIDVCLASLQVRFLQASPDGFHFRSEGSKSVPLHGLSRLEQLDHRVAELGDDALNDVAAVDTLVKSHTFYQTTEAEYRP